MKESLMKNTDLSTEFEKISDQAKAATQHLRTARQHAKDQLAADAAIARQKATAAANRLQDNVNGTRQKASSHCQEMRGKLQAHVAEAETRFDKKADQLDARSFAIEADMAESYALDAIDFAQSTVQEAEYAVLDAMSARADAEALRTGRASGV
jgi:hypothetical protein